MDFISVWGGQVFKMLSRPYLRHYILPGITPGNKEIEHPGIFDTQVLSWVKIKKKPCSTSLMASASGFFSIRIVIPVTS